jgi:hypothetical protein
LCIIRAPNQHKTPIAPSPTLTVQFVEFTYCHDKFPDQALTHKHDKYDPLIYTIQNQGWKTNPLITITAGVRGAIHEHSINKLVNLKIPKSIIKILMKNIHQNAIKYLTYLVLNKRKLENKQSPVSSPP